MIVADILQIATEPVKSTYVQYMANLSHEQLLAYTRMLQQRGSIEVQKDKTGLVTERGKEYSFGLFSSSENTRPCRAAGFFSKKDGRAA
jgi:predicted transcriptional regulator